MIEEMLCKPGNIDRSRIDRTDENYCRLDSRPKKPAILLAPGAYIIRFSSYYRKIPTELHFPFQRPDNRVAVPDSNGWPR